MKPTRWNMVLEYICWCWGWYTFISLFFQEWFHSKNYLIRWQGGAHELRVTTREGAHDKGAREQSEPQKSFFKNKFITSHFSPGHEILTYLVSFYEKFKLYDHTKLNAEVITKTWLSDRRKWQIVIRYKGTRISVAILKFHSTVFFLKIQWT